MNKRQRKKKEKEYCKTLLSSISSVSSVIDSLKDTSKIALALNEMGLQVKEIVEIAALENDLLCLTGDDGFTRALRMLNNCNRMEYKEMLQIAKEMILTRHSNEEILSYFMEKEEK